MGSPRCSSQPRQGCSITSSNADHHFAFHRRFVACTLLRRQAGPAVAGGPWRVLCDCTRLRCHRSPPGHPIRFDVWASRLQSLACLRRAVSSCCISRIPTLRVVCVGAVHWCLPLSMHGVSWLIGCIDKWRPRRSFFSPSIEQRYFFPWRPIQVSPLGLSRFLRSEEHTSELQSLMRISYAVFCLKKKKKKENIT